MDEMLDFDELDRVIMPPKRTQEYELITPDELGALQAENARLRAALEKIAVHKKTQEWTGAYVNGWNEAADIARRALENT